MADEDLSKLSIEKTSPSVQKHRQKQPLKLLFVSIAVIFIIYGLFRYFSPAIVEIETAAVSQVYPTQSFTLLNASGYVAAQRKAAVASKITGRLVSISVEEGTRIHKGDIIARLEAEDAAAAKDRAASNLRLTKANLDQAKAEQTDASSVFRRSRELLEKGFISRLEYDAAETRSRKAEAAVAAAEASIKANSASLRESEITLEYANLRAPFDAVVLTKNADIGDIITPLGAAANAKAAVVTIADMGSLQVEADVSESNISQVKLNQPCEIQLDALQDIRFRGQVHMIVPTADRTKATVLVKVRFMDHDPRILPEMSAKVAFLEKEASPDDLKPVAAVNSESIMSRSGKPIIYVVKDGKAVATEVRTGRKFGDMVELLTDVKSGEKIVRRPSEKLKNITRIRIAVK